MSTLQTLDRGLLALEVISRSPQGISVAELAKQLDVARAICYRIVSTLEHRSLVTRLPDGQLRLGSGVAVLASRFAPQFQHGAVSILDELAEQTGTTSFLSTAQGADCVAIMVAEPKDAVLHVGYRVGTRHPLTQGAAGIAILALRRATADDGEDVVTARADGYSVTRGQLERGAVGIAAGVQPIAGAGDGRGAEYSVGVVALDGLDVDAAATAVRAAGERLSTLLVS